MTRNGGQINLQWDIAHGVDEYLVTRGLASQRAASDYGACIAQGITWPLNYSDAQLPPAGDAFFYLVQGHNFDCGLGSLGLASNELPRTNESPAACQGLPHTDRYPTSDSPVLGTVQGTFNNTLSSNDQYERILTPVSNLNHDLLYPMPSGLSGSVILRVVDSNHFSDSQALDTISIDELWIRSVP